MNIAYDLFAETNPAFGTFGLLGFCRKYVAASRGKPPTLALAYLALPIALSDDLETSFLETAATTGLLSWLNRYPDVRLDLSVRLDASKEIVSAAIRFGLVQGLSLLEMLGPSSLVPGRPRQRRWTTYQRTPNGRSNEPSGSAAGWARPVRQDLFFQHSE